MKLVRCQLIHQRYSPKKYSFRNNFCWFELDLLNLSSDIKEAHWVSEDSFNLFSFYHQDHTQFSSNLKTIDQCQIFLSQHHLNKKITAAKLYTHLRVMGYVFNPVSFYLITCEDGEQCAIIEIGNTFNELKPILVKPNAFSDLNCFKITVDKNFYVSPFIDLDSQMEFDFSLKENILNIVITDKKHELILTSHLKGKIEPYTDTKALFYFFRFPLQTWGIIVLIHWHALKLFLKKIPYHKKADNQHLQQGVYRWKQH